MEMIEMDDDSNGQPHFKKWLFLHHGVIWQMDRSPISLPSSRHKQNLRKPDAKIGRPRLHLYQVMNGEIKLHLYIKRVYIYTICIYTICILPTFTYMAFEASFRSKHVKPREAAFLCQGITEQLSKVTMVQPLLQRQKALVSPCWMILSHHI